MIYDTISNIGKYQGMSKNLDVAIDFLKKTDLSKLPIGRTEVESDKVFVNVMEAEAREESEIQFEIHKKYMDIQIDIEGTELIQIGSLAFKEQEAFKEEIDFGTVLCEEVLTCKLGKGRFILCMGEEPHKPSIASGEERRLKKCVIKVAV